MRGGAIHDRTTFKFVLLCREMDSLQLLTLYLTLTHIFSGGKAKINLHTSLKLTVVMRISYLLQSIQFPKSAKWCDHLLDPLAPVLVFLQLRCMFSVESRYKIVSWTYWLLPGLSNIFAIRLWPFINHSMKIAQFLFGWGSFPFLSKPIWQMMLFVINVNEWRHIPMT